MLLIDANATAGRLQTRAAADNQFGRAYQAAGAGTVTGVDAELTAWDAHDDGPVVVVRHL